jgi:hypothetical protein
MRGALRAKKPLAKSTERRLHWHAWAERPEAIEELCSHIVAGGNLKTWCVAMDAPYTMVRRWLESDTERAKLYAAAKEDRADVLAEDILLIADEHPPLDGEGRTDSGFVAWQKLRVDSRKWTAAKLRPGVYGERVALEHAGKVQFNLGMDTGRVPEAKDVTKPALPGKK